MGPAYYGGYINAFRKVYRARGILGLYDGLLAGVVTSAPYSALFFLTYEMIKKVLTTPTEIPDGKIDDNAPCHIGLGI